MSAHTDAHTEPKTTTEAELARELAESPYFQALVMTTPSKQIPEMTRRELAQKIRAYAAQGYKIKIG